MFITETNMLATGLSNSGPPSEVQEIPPDGCLVTCTFSITVFPIGNLVNLSKSLSPVEILLVDNRSSIK